MAFLPVAVMSAFLPASHAEMLAYHRPTVPLPVAGAETVGVFPSESTTIILSALSDTESTFHALLAESVNLSFLKRRAKFGELEKATVHVPLELVVVAEAVTAILESAPMVYSLMCNALESFTLPEPVVVAIVNVPPVKSPSEVFTTDAVVDAISKSAPPLTATI